MIMDVKHMIISQQTKLLNSNICPSLKLKKKKNYSPEMIIYMDSTGLYKTLADNQLILNVKLK